MRVATNSICAKRFCVLFSSFVRAKVVCRRHIYTYTASERVVWHSVSVPVPKRLLPLITVNRRRTTTTTTFVECNYTFPIASNSTIRIGKAAKMICSSLCGQTRNANRNCRERETSTVAAAQVDAHRFQANTEACCVCEGIR